MYSSQLSNFQLLYFIFVSYFTYLSIFFTLTRKGYATALVGEFVTNLSHWVFMISYQAAQA